MEAKLLEWCNKGALEPRTENNSSLKVSYKGTGGLVSPKWNVKIYTSGSVVCTDIKLLQDMIEDRLKEADKSLKILKIDDAGWGFPLCGVVVGVCDEVVVKTAFVPVKYFQAPLFDQKYYLAEYSKMGLHIVLNDFKATPATHRIEICTGFVNTRLKDDLRNKGFDVRVVEIVGMLQDTLEDAFRQHVKEQVNADMAYDPKAIGDKEVIARKYKAVVEWAKKYHPELLKSGWGSMQK